MKEENQEQSRRAKEKEYVTAARASIKENSKRLLPIGVEFRASVIGVERPPKRAHLEMRSVGSVVTAGWKIPRRVKHISAQEESRFVQQ